MWIAAVVDVVLLLSCLMGWCLIRRGSFYSPATTLRQMKSRVEEGLGRRRKREEERVLLEIGSRSSH